MSPRLRCSALRSNSRVQSMLNGIDLAQIFMSAFGMHCSIAIWVQPDERWKQKWPRRNGTRGRLFRLMYAVKLALEIEVPKN